MSVYTVYEPPLRAADSGPDPERFAFVRDGFSLWAFLFAALWMLLHRMWLVLVAYLVVAVGLEAILHYANVSNALISLTELLLALLIGIESGTLRRFTLARKGWKDVGAVSGRSLEDAERRFFDAWMLRASASRAEPPASAPQRSAPPVTQAPATDVIGLFPEPGARR